MRNIGSSEVNIAASGINSALVVGVNGGFGRAFEDVLRNSGVAVTGMDRAEADVVCDVFADAHVLRNAAPRHDLILLCVAEPVALKSLELLDQQVHDKQIVVDICSVKHNLCAAAQRLCKNAQYLSLHPMFGPERGFAGHNMVGVTVRDGPLCQAMIEMAKSWQVRWLDTDSDTHDKVTAVVQVMTHATLAMFAHARDELIAQVQAPAPLVDAMATPIFAELSRVAEGMLRENPELYHNIQTANPNGEPARQALNRAALTVLGTLGADDPAAVVRMYERLRTP